MKSNTQPTLHLRKLTESATGSAQGTLDPRKLGLGRRSTAEPGFGQSATEHRAHGLRRQAKGPAAGEARPGPLSGWRVRQARLGRRRNRAAPAPSATMPMPAAVVACWEPARLWPWTWRWLPAAPTAMATAALNRNRNHSTGLRLSRADMTFFLPDRGAAKGGGWGRAGVTGLRVG